MSLKLALAVLGTLVVLSGYVRAKPGHGFGYEFGAGGNQNNNNFGNNGGGFGQGAVSSQNNNLGNNGGGNDHGHHHHHKHVDYYAHPHYKYAYAVNDHHTGDKKSAHESRDGDKVTGEYSLLDADGSWRRVTYHADHTGFHAQVHRTPGHHPHGHGHGQNSYY